MGEGPFQQFGAAAMGNGSTSFTPPSMGIPMGMPMGMDATQNAASTFTESMRSFKDSLAFSFQTLNLTLSSLNQSMVNMTTKIGQLGAGGANQLITDPKNQFFQVQNPGLYLGGVSQNFAGYAAQASMWDLMRGRAPAGVNPLEFYTERNNERALRGSSTAIAGLGGLVTEIGTNAFGMRMGSKLAGMLGLGGGITGTLGSMALGMPFFTLGSAALGAVVDPMVDAAIQHNNDVAALRRMSPRFGSGFSLSQAQRAMRGIEDAALTDTLNTTSLDSRMGLKGFRELTMMGLQGNLFQGTSPEDLIKQVESASHVVKFMAGVMGNKDVKETIQLVKQMKDMGVNLFQDAAFARQLSTDAFKYGRISGTDPNAMMATAANMSAAAYGQYGNPAFAGIQSGMRNLAYVQELEKRGMLTPAQLAAGGGTQAIASRALGLEAAMTNSWGVGKPIMFAGMNPGGRGFNQAAFNKTLNEGGYFGVLNQAVSNLWDGGLQSYANAVMSQDELVADMSKQGVLSKNMENALRAQLQMLPGMTDPGVTFRDRINMAAMYIMEIAPGQFGIDIDRATAKMIATRIVNPTVQATIESRGNKVLQKAFTDRINANNGFLRPFEEAGEWYEKRSAKLHHALTDPAKSAADKFASVFDMSNPSMDFEPFGKGSYLSAAKGTQAFVTANELQKNANMFGNSLLFSNSDYATAFAAMQNPDKLSALGAKLGGPLMNVLQYNSMVENRAMWKRIAEGKTMSEADVLAGLSKLSDNGKTMTINDLRNFTKYVDNKWNAIGKVFQASGGLAKDWTVNAAGEMGYVDNLRKLNGFTGRRAKAFSEALSKGLLSSESGFPGVINGMYDEFYNGTAVKTKDVADSAYRYMDFEKNASADTYRILGARIINSAAADTVDINRAQALAEFTKYGYGTNMTADLERIFGKDFVRENVRDGKFWDSKNNKYMHADDVYLRLFSSPQSMANLQALAKERGGNLTIDQLRGLYSERAGGVGDDYRFLTSTTSSAGLGFLRDEYGAAAASRYGVDFYSSLDKDAVSINTMLGKANLNMQELGITSSMATDLFAKGGTKISDYKGIATFFDKVQAAAKNGSSLTGADYAAIRDAATGPEELAVIKQLENSVNNSSAKDFMRRMAGSVSGDAHEAILQGESFTQNGTIYSASKVAATAFLTEMAKEQSRGTNMYAKSVMESLGFNVSDTDAMSKYQNLSATVDALDANNPNLTYEQRFLKADRKNILAANGDQLRDMVRERLEKSQADSTLEQYKGINLDANTEEARVARTKLSDILLQSNAQSAFLQEKVATDEASKNIVTKVDTAIIIGPDGRPAMNTVTQQDAAEIARQKMQAATHDASKQVEQMLSRFTINE